MSTADNATAASGPGAASPSRWWPLLLTLVVVASLGAAAWYAMHYRLAPQAASLITRLTALEQQVGSSANSTGALDQRIQQLEQRTTTHTDDLAAIRAVQEAVTQSVNGLTTQLHARDQASVLANVEDLISFAEQRLSLAQDVVGAQIALNAALTRLHADAEPAQIVLHDQLKHDLAALDAVVVPAVAALARQLAAASAAVDTLPLQPVAKTHASAAATAPATIDDWRGLAAAMWHDLLSLVEIKNADQLDTVLFEPQLRNFMLQNLKLELASARLAVLARDSANLHTSVELITDQLQRYFVTEDAAVRSLLDTLAAARTADLAPSLPSMAESLAAVRTARHSAAAPLAPTAP